MLLNPCHECLTLPVCRNKLSVNFNGQHFEISLNGLNECGQLVEFFEWLFLRNSGITEEERFIQISNAFYNLVPNTFKHITTISVHMNGQASENLEAQRFLFKQLAYVFHVKDAE